MHMGKEGWLGDISEILFLHGLPAPKNQGTNYCENTTLAMEIE